MSMVPAFVLAAACAAAALTPPETNYLAGLGAASEVAGFRENVIARGPRVMPCLQEMFAASSVLPEQRLGDGGPFFEESWLRLLMTMRDIDRDATVEVVRRQIAQADPSDPTILRLAVVARWLGMDGRDGVPSSGSYVVRYMEQGKRPDRVIDAVHAMSLIQGADLRNAVAQRLSDPGSVDSDDERRALQLLLFGLKGELQRLEDEVRAGSTDSHLAAMLLCNMGQAWILAAKDGHPYPAEADVPGVLAAARGLAADLGDELAIVGSWP